ncbi:hypothetical protein Pfo_002167 [Paulownia fortunei]|nr:hypothetical protein Pfo_002167 [Paulownia fortunei]
MSTKKTELKVTINCEKCKTEVLKAVSKLIGVDEVTVNAEKGTLTVVGSVDPGVSPPKSGKLENLQKLLVLGQKSLNPSHSQRVVSNASLLL